MTLNLIKWRFAIIALFTFPKLVFSQFISPVEHNISLTGNFGELRNNHFHEGFDIRKNHNQNENKILAVMDGVVSRIKISPDGYGKMLIIDHPNGYSTLYGHLKRYSPELEEFIKSYQYANHTFEMDVENLNIPIKQGSEVGIMGNTGASRGEHLHFEILDTKTKTKINPEFFNYDIEDTKPPVFEKLRLVGLDYEFNTMNSKDFNVYRKNSNTYYISGDTIKMGNVNIGTEVLVYDLMNANTFHVGIFKLTLFENQKQKFTITFDSISRANFYNYKSHIDYSQYLINGQKYHRAFALPGDKMANYDCDRSSPYITLDYDVPKDIELVAEDYNGNKSSLKFVVVLDENIDIPYKPSYNYHVTLGDKCEIDDEDFDIKIDSNAFFKNVYLLAEKIDTNLANVYSKAVEIYTNKEAFQNSIEVAIKVDKIDENINNLCIVRIDNGQRKILGDNFEDGFMKVNVSEEGIYVVMADDTKPVIKPIRYSANMKKYSYMSFKIDDNFSPNSNCPLKYNGYIDDEWVLFEYDKKNKLITHYFEKTLSAGKHNLKIVVEDSIGNTKMYNSSFVR
ncbi:MAG: M23 family metallopeptidase [Saprospiraceae bacterium]